ncbi:MAG: hemerythrin family protein [Aquabacterium sp.]|nr:hemerythrin family protein [Aquabacterium sp.]
MAREATILLVRYLASPAEFASHDLPDLRLGHEIVDQVLHDLLDYTAGHLRREESLMASVHFPNLVGHKAGHERFILRLKTLQAKYESGSVTVASQLSTVLRDWLSIHIRRDDKELRQFLKHNTKQSL